MSSSRTSVPSFREFLSWLSSHVRTPLYMTSYALILSLGGTAVLGLLYWTVAARVYPAAEVGVQSVLISTTLFVSGLAQLSLNNALIRFLPVAGERAIRIVAASYAASTVAAVVVAVVFILGTPVWSSKLTFLRHDPVWFAGFVGAVVVWSVFTLQDSALAGLRRATWIPIENIAVSGAKVVLLILFQERLVHSGVFAAWMLPSAAAVVVVNLLAYRVVRRAPTSVRVVEHHSLQSIARFAGGNYLGFVFYAAASNLLPLVVLNRTSESQAAYFFLPWTITSVLLLVATSTTTSLTVESVSDLSQLRAFCRRTLVHTFALLAVPVTVLFIAGPTLLRLFGHGYAEHGGTTLRLLSLGVLPNGVVLIGLGVLRIRGRIGQLAALQALSCVLVLGISYVLLPHHGIASVGLAFVVSQFVTAACLLVTDLRPIMTRSLVETSEA